MSNDLQAQFDRWAATYDADVAGGVGFPFAGYDRVLARVIELADLAPGMAVLELGPGTGNLTAQLVERGAAVWALDFSAEMLARARARVPAAHLAQAHLLGDFPADFHRPFDRVVSTYTFHEFPLPDKLALLRRLFADHLCAGGMVVIGDIGFPTVAARDTIRAAAGDGWDDEYYWIMDEVEPALRTPGLIQHCELILSCAIVLALSVEQPCPE